jgi:signal transduction histidine kinase
MIIKAFKPNLQSKISHEIHTPLSAILGLLQFLQATNLTQEQQSYIYDIELSANRLIEAQSIIKNIIKTESKNQQWQ